MVRPLGFIILFIFILSSCSLNRVNHSTSLEAREVTYKQLEVSGEYITESISGFGKNKEFIKKQKIVSSQNRSKVFEKNIVISKRKAINSQVTFLVPYKYEATYYLNNDIYTVTGELDLKKKEIVYNLNSPEYKWLGQKSYQIQDNVKAICFYATIIECGIVSGFISKAIERKNGDMNFHVLWESYPYFQEQYLNMPKEILSQAVLSYDQLDKKGNYRFLLSVGGQSIVYILNKKLDIIGHYWTAQGLSKERI